MLNKQFVDPPAVFLQQIFNNGKVYNLVDRLKSPLILLSLCSLIKAPTNAKANPNSARHRAGFQENESETEKMTLPVEL